MSLLQLKARSFPLLSTVTSKFPLLISDAAEVRTYIGLRILRTRYRTTAPTTMFKTANIACRINKFCELTLVYSPNPITNVFEEFLLMRDMKRYLDEVLIELKNIITATTSIAHVKNDLQLN